MKTRAVWTRTVQAVSQTLQSFEGCLGLHLLAGPDSAQPCRSQISHTEIGCCRFAQQALEDFRERIAKYEEVYETITDRNLHYIKLIDMCADSSACAALPSAQKVKMFFTC